MRPAPDGMNKKLTGTRIDAKLTQPRSGSVRYQLISAQGWPVGTYDTALEAASAAGGFWPGQGQDPDRSGVGWDIQTA